MVNILDPWVVEEARKRLRSHSDLLKTIWAEVEKLQIQYHSNTESKLWQQPDLNSKDGQKLVKWTIFCLAEELFELANALKNRPWVNTEYPVDVNRLYDELADAAIFFIILCHQLRLSPEKLAEIVIRKAVVNEWRIKSKY